MKQRRLFMAWNKVGQHLICGDDNSIKEAMISCYPSPSVRSINFAMYRIINVFLSRTLLLNEIL